MPKAAEREMPQMRNARSEFGVRRWRQPHYTRWRESRKKVGENADRWSDEPRLTCIPHLWHHLRMEATPPPSLLAWLPYLWRHVLFAGPSSASNDVPRRATLLWLIVLPGVLLYPCLSFELFEPDESRYAQIPREMLQRSDWVVPYLQGEPYLDKPPLTYWMIMVSYQLFGVSEAAARLVPALAIHLTILLAYLFGRRWIGESAAFRGALVLTLAPAFLGMGRLLILDGVLTLWTSIALFAGFEAIRGPTFGRGWWRLASFGCALGVLTKGPIAIILLLPPLLAHCWLSGTGLRLDRRAWLTLTGIVLLLNLPWYVAASLRQPDFAYHFLWEHNIVRFIAPFDHPQSVWYYVPVVLLGLFPASLLLVSFVRFLLSGNEQEAAARTPEMGYLLLAAGWCLLFFTLSGCKLPTYILPAFPPMALALGSFLASSGWRASRWPMRLAATSFALLLVFHHVALPWYAEHRSPMREEAMLRRYFNDPSASVVCYPRPCNVVAFRLNRDDLRTFRSKDIEALRTLVRSEPRTVVLCTHRNSLEGLRELLPPEVRIVETHHFGLPDVPGLPRSLQTRVRHLMGRTALGLSDLAVIEFPGYTPAHARR
jgi:4-amino-4-deoxy-L-arabinose transferase-like glycosyltransferase